MCKSCMAAQSVLRCLSSFALLACTRTLPGGVFTSFAQTWKARAPNIRLVFGYSLKGTQMASTPQERFMNWE